MLSSKPIRGNGFGRQNGSYDYGTASPTLVPDPDGGHADPSRPLIPSRRGTVQTRTRADSTIISRPSLLARPCRAPSTRTSAWSDKTTPQTQVTSANTRNGVLHLEILDLGRMLSYLDDKDSH